MLDVCSYLVLHPTGESEFSEPTGFRGYRGSWGLDPELHLGKVLPRYTWIISGNKSLIGLFVLAGPGASGMGTQGRWKWQLQEGKTATGNLQCHYVVLPLPDFPCGSYTAFFFQDCMHGSPRQNCHFDLEADLKGHNDTWLFEGPVFPWAKHCQFQHTFIWRYPARFLK